MSRSNPVLGSRLTKVLEWAVAQGLFMEASTQTTRPAFLLSGPMGERVVSFYSDGAIYCRFGQAAPKLFAGGVDDRNRFVSELKQLNLIDASVNPDAVVWGRQLNRRLDELNDKELNDLLAVFAGSLKSRGRNDGC